MMVYDYGNSANSSVVFSLSQFQIIFSSDPPRQQPLNRPGTQDNELKDQGKA